MMSASRIPGRSKGRALNRWGALAAILGGVLWSVGAIVTALKPEGCVMAECDLPGRTMREGSALDGVLFIGSVLLIAVGMAAVVVRVRVAGRFGKLARLGTSATTIGGVLLLAGVLVQAFFFGGDFPYMPFVVVPGLLAVVFGVLLLGVSMPRAGVLPRWTGALLAAGALAMLLFNDQNAQALMAIPFGVAWVAVGYALWSEQRIQPERTPD